MQRFYANLLGRRPGLTGPLPKAEALREAKAWLRGLHRAEVLALTAAMSGGVERSKDAKARQPAELAAAITRRRGQRPAVRIAPLLGRIRASRRPGLIGMLEALDQPDSDRDGVRDQPHR